MSSSPPVLADWLIRRLCPEHIVPDLLGDLHEEWNTRRVHYGALRVRAWYWTQGLGSVAHYRVARRGSRGRRATSESGQEAHRIRGREATVGGIVGSTIQDVRLAVRGLVRIPGMTAVALMTLALCIGANTTIFSVLQSVLLRPLPYPEPDRILEIAETHPERGWTISFSHPNFWDVWEQNESLAHIAARAGTSMNLTGVENAERLSGGVVSVDFFRVLGIEPVVGRNFRAGEDQPGNDNRVVLLGNNLWRRRFGGETGIVGQSVLLDNVSYTVIGVLPPAQPFPGQTDVFVPLVRGSNTHRSDHRLFVIGRLKPDMTPEGATTDLNGIATAIGDQDSDGPLTFSITPSSTWIAGNHLRVALWVLMGAVGFLLLIACVNVTNLLLVRAVGRRREYAICSALGATRAGLVRRNLIESMILCLAGSGLGVVLATQGVRAVRAVGPDSIPRISEIGVNGWVMGFTILVSLATGLAVGIVPGLQLDYGKLVTALRDGGRGSAGGRRHNRTRNILVVAETALSLLLLIGAGLMLRSFKHLQSVDTGFESENRISLDLSLPRGYGPERTHTLLEQIIGRIERLPRVLAAGAVNMQPIGGGSVGMGLVPVEQLGDDNAVVWVDWRLVTPDYFRTLGLSILSGRGFSERDRREEPARIVISQPLADRLWPDQDPVGKRAALWAEAEQPAEIVGVVDGMRERGPQADPTMVVYFPYYGFVSGSITIVVHTLGEPTLIVPPFRDVVQELDPDIPISNIAMLDELVGNAVSGNRFNMLLLTVFAAVALVLAVAGIYSVLAYSVTRRSSEIGLRVALGASESTVLRQIVMLGMRPVMVGIVLGMIAAVALSRFMSTLLFEVAPTDPVTYAAVMIVLTLAALGACYLPARKALSVDPTVALARE